MARKPSDSVRLNLRLTEALRSRLEKNADKNQHSLNEEIVRRLEESFAGDDFKSSLEKLSETMTVKLGDMTLKNGKWTREGDGK